MIKDSIIELSEDEISQVSGGLIPLIPIAVAFGKGAIGGAGAAAVVHSGFKFYKLATS